MYILKILLNVVNAGIEATIVLGTNLSYGHVK